MIAKILQTLAHALIGLILLSIPCQARICEKGCQYCSCWEQRRGGENLCIKKGFLNTTNDCMRWCARDPEGIFKIAKDAWDECELD